MDDRARLRVLLTHWIEHNKEHQQEFSQGAQKARALGEETVSDDIRMAAGRLEESNASLTRALEKLT